MVAESGDREGLGLVLVEALGCGCPVVASDLPAVRDVIADGESGRLVPPGDARMLAAAIVELLDAPERRLALADRGRRHCLAHFDWPRIAERYAALLVNQYQPNRVQP